MVLLLPKKPRKRIPRRKSSRDEARAAAVERRAAMGERRRSDRLATHIPAILLGKDAAGREFFDRSEIISVDGSGARMRTRFSVLPGAILEVQLTNEMLSKRMRVVWQGERGSMYEGLIGLEFEDHQDQWYLRMLRARWEEST